MKFLIIDYGFTRKTVYKAFLTFGCIVILNRYLTQEACF